MVGESHNLLLNLKFCPPTDCPQLNIARPSECHVKVPRLTVGGVLGCTIISVHRRERQGCILIITGKSRDFPEMLIH
jgi:hypothetical protein